MFDNFIINTDTYKATHFTFEEDNTTSNYAYIEARPGGPYKEVMVFGIQDYIKRYLLKPITQDMIDDAEEQLMEHVGVFNKEGWQYILDVHDGYIPVEIKCLPEGMVVPVGTVMVTVESTDSKCSWIASYIETALQRAAWYGSTIATRSWRWKNKLLPLLAQSGSPETIAWKVVDFGSRGVECAEAAGIGGAAHLINFCVTDNQLGIYLARKSYPTKTMPGYSVPATEHSVTTAWGRDRELDFYRNIIKKYGSRPGPRQLVSVVIDTYDQDKALEMWGTELKDELIASNMCLVARPDSGDPVTNVIHVLDKLGSLFGFTTNDRGYRVLPDYVRVIQGDGIDEETLVRIAKYVNANLWSLDNLTFGSGGGLLQKDVTRDTHRFAQKTSEVIVDGQVRACQKMTPGKESKRGRFSVIKDTNNQFQTVPELTNLSTWSRDYLEIVYLDGLLIRDMSFDEVRANAN